MYDIRVLAGEFKKPYQSVEMHYCSIIITLGLELELSSAEASIAFKAAGGFEVS